MRAIVRAARFTRGRGRPSAKLLRACAAFGLGVERVPARGRVPGAERAARAIDRLLRPGEIALVAGPSGCGKSTVLRALARRWRAREVAVGRSRRAIIDAIPGGPARAMRTLAMAGLGDALLLPRRPGELSEGERWRFALARAMSRRGRPLVLDEFASVLDRATARSVSRTLSRWARREGRVRVACATAHDDVERWLAPEVVARPIDGRFVVERTRGRRRR